MKKIKDFLQRHKKAIFEITLGFIQGLLYGFIVLAILGALKSIDDKLDKIIEQEPKTQEKVRLSAYNNNVVSAQTYINASESDFDSEINLNGQNENTSFIKYFNTKENMGDLTITERVYVVNFYDNAVIFLNEGRYQFDTIKMHFYLENNVIVNKLNEFIYDNTTLYYWNNATEYEQVEFYGAIKSSDNIAWFNEYQANGVFNYYYRLKYNSSNSTSLTLGLENWNANNYYTLANYPSNVIAKNGGANIYITKSIDLDFVSKGNAYDSILLVWGVCYKASDNNGNITDYGNTNVYQTFDSMYYRLKGTNNSNYHTMITLAYGSNNQPIGINAQGAYDLVCKSQVLKNETLTFDGLSALYKVYLPNMPYIWVDDELKTITTDKDLLQVVPYPLTSQTDVSDPFINKTWQEIIMLGYNTSNINAYTDINGSQVGNVFTLFGDTFVALLPLLNISIVPGITIGLMLFIPLIATIILVVIKLVKK